MRWKWTLAGAVAIVLSYGAMALDDATVYRMGREDGLFEDLTAVAFFCASVIFFILFLRGRSGNDLLIFRTRRNVFFLFLSLLFLFGAGEEISWGQRIIGWDTPGKWSQANLQGETNFHNLNVFHRRDETGATKSGLTEMITAERLFSLFWLGFCIMVPLLHLVWPAFRRLIERIGMPIVPLLVGLLFLANYFIAEALKSHAASRQLDWPLAEIKEFLYGALFLIIAIYFATSRTAHLTPAASATSPTPSPGDVALPGAARTASSG